jgi:hypothetical protein
MRNYPGRKLLGATTLITLSLLVGAGSALAQQPPPPKPDAKDEAKKKEEEAKKREEEAKKLAAAVAEQKKAAQANWDTLGIGEPAVRDTAHLLLYAPKASEKRLVEASQALERAYALAHQALGVKPEAPPWPGKLTVYLFTARDQYTHFRRRVEKQKVEPEITHSFQLGDAPHVATSPGQSVGDLSIEGQAAEQLATAMLTKQTEGFTIAPWLHKGFGRATYYRAFPTTRNTVSERQFARDLARQVNKVGVDSVFNERYGPDRAHIMRASLVDFMAYGPGNPTFPAFVAAFKPDAEKKQRMRGTFDALKEVAIDANALEKAWRAWLLGGGP